MARVIYKFGGTSVGDTRRLYRAARRIAAAHRAGDEVVAVLSAQAGATDALLARGREIDPDCAESMNAIISAARSECIGGTIYLAGLGRGGSDTTAVALAAFLHADLCRIYTDVDGVYDRDPRLHPDAVKYGRISYDDMLLLARGGARVLHDRCVELARREHVVLEVCSAFSDAPGTIVG